MVGQRYGGVGFQAAEMIECVWVETLEARMTFFDLAGKPAEDVVDEMAQDTFVQHGVVAERLARLFVQKQLVAECSIASQGRIHRAAELPFVLVEE